MSKYHSRLAELFIESLDSDEVCLNCPAITVTENYESFCPCEWDWFDERCVNKKVVERIMDLVDEIDEELKSVRETQSSRVESYRHEL